MEQFIKWFHREQRNFWYTIGGLAITFILGIFLTFILPRWAKSSALDAAQLVITTAEQGKADASQEYNEQKLWFLPPYVMQVPGQLQHVQEDIDRATSSFDDASTAWSVDESVSLAKSSKKSAQNASTTIEQIWITLHKNQNDRTEAMQQTESVTAAYSFATQSLSDAGTRYKTESYQYLLKYTESMAVSLATADSDKGSAKNHIDAAQAITPPLDDTSKSGDPTVALQNLEAAKLLIDEINTLASQVTSGLDDQIEAAQNVSSTIALADDRIGFADNHLSQVSALRGYTFDKALKGAHDLYVRAIGYRDQAKATMASPVANENNKVDAFAAYEEAKQAIVDANSTVDEANRQVAFEDVARNSLAQYQVALTTANNAMSLAAGDRMTLSNNHASDTWSDVSDNLVVAQHNIEESETHRQNALLALDLNQQRLEDAQRESDLALTALSNTTSLAKAVTDRADYLEKFRSDWPPARSRAQSEIDNNDSQVRSYGSYDTNARNSFNSAIETLAKADNEAASRYFEFAYTDAVNAESLASGTGNQAYQAYQDEMDRQEAEAERVRQAQEEAQRQINNADSGGGGGGGSCCEPSGGNSEPYDGGDFNSSPSGGDGGDFE